MLKEYNSKSLAYGLPGLVLQVAGRLMAEFHPGLAFLGNVVMLLGTGLLMAGLAYYAMAKGRDPAWCMMALLSVVGLLVLARLEDRSDEQRFPKRGTPKPVSRPSRRAAGPIGGPAASPDPGPGHHFNAVGVCTKCGCGRSAAHFPCRS